MNEQIAECDRRLEIEKTPLHMRDSRCLPDDGYGNYLTMAEEAVRAPFVGLLEYKKKILKELKEMLGNGMPGKDRR